MVSGAERPRTGGSQKNMAKKQKREIGACPFKGGSPAKAHTGAVPNKVFAATDDAFKARCEAAGVQPTARQASKFRMGKGSAFNFKG